MAEPRVVVVTGASGGVGRAVARRFGARGDRVALLARGEAGLIGAAADHPRRREYWVGGSTVATLATNAVAPGALDRYLARTGYSSQQTDDPRDPREPTNLWKPVDRRRGRDWLGRDYGPHGDFDDRSTGRSVQLWVTERRRTLAAAAGAAGAAIALGWLGLRAGRAR